jgi:hypothetical protein
LFGGFAAAAARLGIVLWHSFAVEIHGSEIELSFRISLFRPISHGIRRLNEPPLLKLLNTYAYDQSCGAYCEADS